MQKYKYLFVEIKDHEQVSQKFFKSRKAAIAAVGRKLEWDNNNIREIVYHDSRKHQQELVCENGTRFLINRV